MSFFEPFRRAFSSLLPSLEAQVTMLVVNGLLAPDSIRYTHCEAIIVKVECKLSARSVCWPTGMEC